MLGTVFLFLNIGGGEMILIVFAALMLFGGEKLPELARGLGKGIRDFKDASEDVKREINNQINNYEDKKTEIKTSEEEQKVNSYEPVAGALPAYEGHAATDAIEETEIHNPEAPETYEHKEVEQPAIEHEHSGSIDLQKKDEPVAKTTEEHYK
ncbi:Sec-independent protein translocase subunit TatA/TatB [Mucilaginibacter glaciei]|uniref:Sec-independent protein translocase protein TatA n=1 Tax=Mucilaginibacter glaciei TaxID=2772109 RepID=A0A926NRE6_9SPHI|nr:twin-arginine translocase TatA/TatE family subunit [Mucilaginibacter glaciei]MBD1393978.1 twin-arginine translocase TatA/TatE family subunit [Mucilaginibacter glaciei]